MSRLRSKCPAATIRSCVHTSGMTATLEAHWRQPLAVDLIADDLLVDQRLLYRYVALYTEEQGERQVVELATMRIALDTFPAMLRSEFVRAFDPSGAFWRARASLYGRVNELRGEGDVLSMRDRRDAAARLSS